MAQSDVDDVKGVSRGVAAMTVEAETPAKPAGGGAGAQAVATPSAEQRFLVNGRVPADPTRRGTRCYVPPANLASYQRMLMLIRRSGGGLFSVHGPRQSGKTTALDALVVELRREYDVCIVSLQFLPPPRAHLSDRKAEKEARQWWEGFEQLLFAQTGQAVHGEERDKLSAKQRVSRVLSSGGTARQLVVIFDEGDTLHSGAHSSFRKEFLEFWRGQKDQVDPTTPYLRAALLVGTFEVLLLNCETGSPFNIAESVSASNFTPAQVRELFEWFVDMVPASRDAVDRIAVDVHKQTTGHAGLVITCGKFITEYCWSVAGVDERLWNTLSRSALPSFIVGMPTGSRMLMDIRSLKAERFATARKVLREAIEKSYLLEGQTVHYTTGSPEDVMCQYFVVIGVLTAHGAPEAGTFVMRCPLIRAALDTAAVCAMPRVTDGLPTFDSVDDLPGLLCTAIKQFDPAHMKEAAVSSAKSYEKVAGVAAGTHAPCESVYHFQLVTVLQSALSAAFMVLPSANALAADSDGIMDILITHHTAPFAVIELVAHERLSGPRKSTVASHITRVKNEYVTGVVRVVLVAFYLDTGEKDAGDWGVTDDELTVMYVFHDAAWTRARATWFGPATGGEQWRHDETLLGEHGCPITWGLLSQKRAIAKQLTEEWRWRAGNGPDSKDDYLCAAHCEDMMRIWNSTAAQFCTRVDEVGPVVRESPSSLASVFVSDCAIVGYRAARALTGASDDYVAAAAADDAMEFAMLFRRLGGDMEYFHNCVDDVATPKWASEGGKAAAGGASKIAGIAVPEPPVGAANEQ